MKKKYIGPELTIHLVQLGNMLALSSFDDYATSEPVLSKGSSDWDIWGDGSDSDSDFDDEY